MKEVAERGGIIAVVGWIDSNHDDITRSLQKSKLVLFMDEIRHSIPRKAELVIFTTFVPAHVKAKASKGRIATKLGFHTGEIKRMLDVVPIPLSSKPKQYLLPRTPVETEKKLVPNSVEKEEKQIPDFVAFVAQFNEIAKGHRNKWVGRKTLAKLRAEFGITESADKLVSLGWVVSHIASGKEEIGWYSAGNMMGVLEPATTPYAEVATHVTVPADPRVAKMLQVFSEEPKLLEEKARLGIRLKEIEDQLCRIDLLKEAVDAL